MQRRLYTRFVFKMTVVLQTDIHKRLLRTKGWREIVPQIFGKRIKMNENKKLTKSTKIKRLTESAILIALATVLSVLKLYEMPYGGSLTLASMMPIMIIAYRHGTAWGSFTAFLYGVIQQLLSVSTLSYVTTWQSVVAVIFLDYVVAFAVCGLGGVFRKTVKNQTLAMVLGTVLCCVLRYICHVISGCTVWAGLSIPTSAAFWYSLLYNASYMIPETLITAAAVYYVSGRMDLTKALPVRKRRESEGMGTAVLDVLGGGVLLGAFVYDVITVFSVMQNESGEFDITGITSLQGDTVKWLIIINVI